MFPVLQDVGCVLTSFHSAVIIPLQTQKGCCQLKLPVYYDYDVNTVVSNVFLLLQAVKLRRFTGRALKSLSFLRDFAQ